MYSRLITVFTLCVSAFLLIAIALINGYPFVYWDTGAYILSGMEGRVPFDRPIMYGLFVRHVSLKASLWLVIFTQGLILSYVIYVFIRCFINTTKPLLALIGGIMVLIYSTGVGIHVSHIMPDIFTAVAVICLIVLLVSKQVNKIDKTVLSVLFIFSILVHLSNLLVLIVILLSLLLLRFIFRGKTWFVLKRKNIFYVSSLFVTSVVLFFTINFIYTKQFFISKAGHVFVMARMTHNGILKAYLDDKCAQRSYKLCAYKDSLVWDFMWDQKSPLYKTYNLPNAYDNWAANKTEYMDIIWGTLTERKYLLMHLQNIVETTFLLVATVDNEVAFNAPTVGAVKDFFERDERQYLSALQWQKKIDFMLLNIRQRAILLLSVLFLCALFFVPNLQDVIKKKNLLPVVALVIIALFANAFICGNLSSTAGRFQARVVWLLPMLVLLLLTDRDVRIAFIAWAKKLLGVENVSR